MFVYDTKESGYKEERKSYKQQGEYINEASSVFVCDTRRAVTKRNANYISSRVNT